MATHASAPEHAAADLQERARRHLWLHFARMGAFDDAEIPVIVRGDGCHVFDSRGRRYLDGLSALYCVNVGHGRAELADAGIYRDAIRMWQKVVELAPASPEGVSAQESITVLQKFVQ